MYKFVYTLQKLCLLWNVRLQQKIWISKTEQVCLLGPSVGEEEVILQLNKNVRCMSVLKFSLHSLHLNIKFPLLWWAYWHVSNYVDKLLSVFFFNHKERKHKSAPTSIYFVNNLLFSSHTFCLYENTFSIYASILLFYIKINPCPFQVKTTHKGGAAFFLSHVAARCTARYTISIRQGGEHCVVISSRCGISTEQ